MQLENAHMLTINKYIYIAYDYISPITSEDKKRLARQIVTDKESRLARSRMATAYGEKTAKMVVPRRHLPDYRMCLAGADLERSKNSCDIPNKLCACMIWLGSAADIGRSPNSKIILLHNTGYSITTWTDIFGHSRHGKMSYYKSQENKKQILYLNELSPRHFELASEAFTEYVSKSQ